MERQEKSIALRIRCVDGFRMKFMLMLVVILVMLVEDVISQRIWEERKGCIRAQGNLGGGYLFGSKAPSAYLNGDIDLFVEDRVAVTGAAFYSFALNRKNEVGLKANHAVFFGINYHFLKPQRFDPFVGLTPGMGIVQAAYKDGDALKRTPYSPVPLVAAQVGFNYYVGSIFNFFAKVQGVTGHFSGPKPGVVRLDELKFMAGLGWNMRAWKPKVKDVWKEGQKHRTRKTEHHG